METQNPIQPSQPQTTSPAPVSGTNGHKTAPHRYIRPRASVTETNDGFTVEVEMPGVQRSGLEITFENGELTLVGHRATSAGHGDGHEVIYRESTAGDYRRAFELDNTIDASRINARLDQGLLTLSLPKAEASKPRRIEIGGLS